MGTSLTVERIGKTLVVVHRPPPIVDAEWDAMVKQLRGEDVTGVVIWANHHPPNSRQRNSAHVAFLGGDNPPNVAILSDSVIIRAVVSLINVFTGDSVRMFAQSDLTSAYTHARVVAQDVEAVTAAIERLRQPLP